MGILEVTNVNKRFGGLQALGNVNLDIAAGTVHAIIGPNGAGKSTLLNCLVGKLIPDTGTVMFDGQSVLGRKPYEINQMGISRVFQTPEIFGDAIIARKDIGTSYHLASVHDDALQGITHIIRGTDLAAAAHLHRLLQVLLDLPEPTYRHHRLLTDDAGKKLSKRDLSPAIRDLRNEGMSAADLRRSLGFADD